VAGRKQQTFAKLQRERRVKEKRQLKLEKKQAAAAAKLAASEDPSSVEGFETEGLETEGLDTSDGDGLAMPEPSSEPSSPD
jgi:hypothetical protein